MKMFDRKLNIWDVLFYLSMTTVLVWVILKSFGIIQTPFWLEYGVPVGGFAIGVITLYHNLIRSINNLEVGFAVLTTRFAHLEKDVGKIETDVSLIKRKIKLS